MKRRLFTILCGLSLLLCVGTAALWVRSYWYLDDLNYPKVIPTWGITSQLGSVVFVWRVSPPVPIPQDGLEFHGHRLLRGSKPFHGSTRWSFLGIEVIDGGCVYLIGPNVWTVRSSYLVVPYWLPCVLTMILPAIWIIRRYRSRPHPIGFCQKCGYNLTGNVSGICPECGTVIAAKAP